MLSLEPIGYMRCRPRSEFLTPVQPEGEKSRSVVELVSGRRLEVALQGLEGFTRIWLLWCFHQKRGWKPKVLPPRGRVGRQGLFATRSPHRPNPLGMSCVQLITVDQNRLEVGDHDLLDGTPILDIKPYIPRFDSFPEASAGWFAHVERDLEGPARFEVVFPSQARARLAWLEEREPGLERRVRTILSRDPFPHRTRRIVGFQDGYRLSCGCWRVFYQVKGRNVTVQRIASRHPFGEATDPLHREFQEAFLDS